MLKSTGFAFGAVSIAVVADTSTAPGAGFGPGFGPGPRAELELELESRLGPVLEGNIEAHQLGGFVKRRAERILEQHRLLPGNC